MTEAKQLEWEGLKSVWYQVFNGNMPSGLERLLLHMGFSLDDCEDIYQNLDDERIAVRRIEAEYREHEIPKLREAKAQFKEEVSEDWQREVRLEYLKCKAVDDYQHARNLEKARRDLHPSLLALEFDIILGYGVRDINKAWKKYRSTMINHSVVNLDKVSAEDDNKFSETVIEQARAVPVESLVGTEFIKVVGGRKQTLCPFHDEKTPSFYVFPDNHWHCFGCNAHGNNAIDYIMQKNSIDFPDAVKALANV